MKQNKQHFNIWKYLPTWKEAKWWIIAVMIWAILSSPIILYPPLRESILISMGSSMTFIIALLPIVWALLLLSIVWPFASQSQEALIPCLFLGVILGGLAGYLLRTIFKLTTKS